MEIREFHNALRVLRSIDRDEIMNRSGLAPMLSDVEWRSFRDGPYDFFIKCDDPTCNAIWAAMQRRIS